MPRFEHDDCDEVLIGPMWKRERMVLGLKRSELYLMAAEAQKFHSALPDVSEAMSPPVTRTSRSMVVEAKESGKTWHMSGGENSGSGQHGGLM